ncbi:MAG: exodeoxyribonuclease VII large subunit [Bacteriovoracaceae bacterium]|nr:exodeoxyribonuclease VII large subunit [Halobacteriovoraceae bacterium]MDP7320287.1 exodeoxyribonuclease VII large subunit [Bacteriovoracaceae bacterium]
MIEQKVSSVSEVIQAIKTTLEFEYSDLVIEGEVSNLSHSSAGHYYFNLSDENSTINCALFKIDALRNPVIKKMKNGDKIIISGPLGLYAKRGSFQVICKRVTPAGKGDLKVQFEVLKKRLAAQGYFDPLHKKQIPTFPQKVAVITALRGAALQDFLNVIKRRSMWFDICIIPSVVQGEKSAASLVSALDKAEQLEGIDVIVVTRGGGSMEDLWSFNDEKLIMKAYQSSIPIISAVGHQVDYTLLDYVADYRCETPSAAAEVLSQYQTELSKRLRFCLTHIRSQFKSFRLDFLSRLERVNPLGQLSLLQKKIHHFQMRLEKFKYLEQKDLVEMNQKMMFLDELSSRMENVLAKKSESHAHKLNLLERSLLNLSPGRVLERGYSYIRTEKGSVITSKESFDTIKKDDILNIQFFDGSGKVRKVES